MQNQELLKGSRYQRQFPEDYFYEDFRRNDEAYKIARKDIEDYYMKRPYVSPERIKEELMKYSNTRLQYLLMLYYYNNSEQNIYFVYKSAYMVESYNPVWATEAFLYKTLWTDITDFFELFHADFVSTSIKRYGSFTGNVESLDGASNFCDLYFKWLSKKLSEQGKVSFEEVSTELKKLLN